MDYIRRDIDDNIFKLLQSGKVLLLLGPRRVGKTLFLRNFLKQVDYQYFFLNGEDITTTDLLKTKSIQNYKNIIGDRKLLVIDEAQKIEDIGLILKIMIDNIDGLMILATGSSAFDILNYTGEPLTGRKKTQYMYPFSENELNKLEDPIQKKDNLKERLVFGSYPELYHYQNRDDKIDYLRDLANSYLLKDILMLDGIRHSSKILNLLKLIAFQVGSLVSINELAQQLGLSGQTVEKYLDLLTKVFILYPVSGFSNNLRKEISKSSKWYFLDNGIRNILTANMNPFDLRNDIGKLWENYLVSERVKFQSQNRMPVYNYFWRTYDRQEIDWIEQRDGNLYAHEFKWKQKRIKIPGAWSKSYPDAEFQEIHSDNYLDWLSNPKKN